MATRLIKPKPAMNFKRRFIDRSGLYETALKIQWALDVALFRAKLWLYRKTGRGPFIVVSRRWGMGDIISTFPALNALKQKYPRSYIVYRTVKNFVSLARMCDDVDEAVEDDWPSRFQKYNPCDYEISLNPADEEEVSHIVDRYGINLGLELRSRQPKLTVPQRCLRKLSKRLGPFKAKRKPIVAIHAGPSVPVRTWPSDHWNHLAGILVDQLGATVIQVGADYHSQAGQIVTRVVGALDWVGDLTLEETAAVISLCDLFIGIDSGLLHLAGAVGTPIVGLFGPVNPALRLPAETPSVGVAAELDCIGCNHRIPRLHWTTNCPYDIKCMRVLEPSAVLHAVTSMLGASNA
jgi:ADP-heptose:LPS heptosyltransferase